jgi:archaeoflavoprotein AfpA
LKIAWGITGAGDRLLETLDVMRTLIRDKELEVEVFLSKAGFLVSKYYKIYEALLETFDKVWLEKDSNTPFLTARLHMGEFDILLVAPATSNTVAKVSIGISDTLLTNAIIQGVKGYVPVYIMPTDMKEGETITKLPSGKSLRLRVRSEDVLNVKKLEAMDGINIIEGPEGILRMVEKKCS